MDSGADKDSPGRLLDGQCKFVMEKSPHAVVAWWLMASYAYYIQDMSIISDELYDRMAKDMLERWEEIRHPHKKLITVENLKAGSLYDLKSEDYPSMVKGAASQLIKSSQGVSIDLRK
ncbi:MAG: hypothetical protein KJZ83_00020 [Burkholderiaceae bacterium]|nr:hypothetical protein [Burkholderiaceae bacterium]